MHQAWRDIQAPAGNLFGLLTDPTRLERVVPGADRCVTEHEMHKSQTKILIQWPNGRSAVGSLTHWLPGHLLVAQLETGERVVWHFVSREGGATRLEVSAPFPEGVLQMALDRIEREANAAPRAT